MMGNNVTCSIYLHCSHRMAVSLYTLETRFDSGMQLSTNRINVLKSSYIKRSANWFKVRCWLLMSLATKILFCGI